MASTHSQNWSANESNVMCFISQRIHEHFIHMTEFLSYIYTYMYMCIHILCALRFWCECIQQARWHRPGVFVHPFRPSHNCHALVGVTEHRPVPSASRRCVWSLHRIFVNNEAYTPKNKFSNTRRSDIGSRNCCGICTQSTICTNLTFTLFATSTDILLLIKLGWGLRKYPQKWFRY